MTSSFPTIPRVSLLRPEAARMLALRLVCAEEDLHLLARGEIDAIIGPRGNTYLLRAAQERLQEDIALYRALVDGAPDGILVTDRAEKTIFRNRRLGELWKVPPEIAESGDDEPQAEFLRNRTKDPIRHAERLAYLRAHPAEASRDEIELADGSILGRDSAPLRGETGELAGRVWIFRDVTEERQRERSLAADLCRETERACKAQVAYRAKSSLLAVMSHEVRTPLNGILGYSDLLAKVPGLSEDCQEHVRTIVSSGEALLRILDDVLISSRLEAGRLPLECTPISPGDILRDIQAFLTLPAAKKGLALFVAIEEGVPPQLTNDAGRLRQVLLNLASNAVKFTSHGSVTLGVQPAAGDPGVVFFVRDTGEGIPGETLGAIFDPFAQADPSVGRRHGGTGLGLSISRDLTELMGGKLTVKSEVGVGSVFTVTLPLSAPEAEGEP